MSTEVGEKLYTIPEFLAIEWPEDDENEYELIKGRIVAKTSGSTSAKHGRIVGKLSQYLNNFLDSSLLGKLYAEASCTLDKPDGINYPKPDVSFVAKGRTPEDFDGPIPVAPDLIIEVWSPSDDTETIQNKIEAYQQAGVRLIWGVYMVHKYVIVYKLNDPDIKLFNSYNGILDGGEVLPGFELPVSKLFE
jgi:Uma2 family endonuclease